MRENKSTSLIILSLLLLTLSLVFLCLWGYNFYNDTQKQKVFLLKKSNTPTIATSNNIRDSLLTIYTSTIDKLDSRINSTKISADSLLGNIDNRLNEINRLKEEIVVILKNKSNSTNLGAASEKIGELQLKIDQLQSQNREIENGNKNLKKLLQQIIAEENSGAQNLNRPSGADKLLGAKINSLPVFTTADIRLFALTSKDEKDMETTEADETEKLNGSFTVKSNNYQSKSAEIIVVVTQPNGKVLQNSVWEAGTFDTPEGKKNYSDKMHFDYSPGEAKKLQLSLSSEKFQKGNYTIQIYYNGSVIGKMVKSLS
jgi:hypothetical protein